MMNSNIINIDKEKLEISTKYFTRRNQSGVNGTLEKIFAYETAEKLCNIVKSITFCKDCKYADKTLYTISTCPFETASHGGCFGGVLK